MGFVKQDLNHRKGGQKNIMAAANKSHGFKKRRDFHHVVVITILAFDLPLQTLPTTGHLFCFFRFISLLVKYKAASDTQR